jgi:CheY-like chemotaxis protein
MGARILFIDDDEAVRSTVGKVLTAEGFQIVEARNGLHAMQQMTTPPLPDIILLDMIMPVMSGYEFLDLQQADPRIRNIPVIAITGHAKVAQAPSVRRLVRKPFNLRELSGVLREVLDERV